MFDFKHVRSFVVLADRMHFGRAARELGVSQSTLSAQMRALEEELGGPLLNRSNRTMALTPLGETFLLDAHKLIMTAECAKHNAADILNGTSSTLRLGVCSAAISSGLVGAVLAEARVRFPSLKIIAEEAPPASLAKLLANGSIDVMMSLVFGLRFDAPVAAQTIGRCPFVLLAAEDSGYIDADGNPDMDTLREAAFILYENRHDSPFVVDNSLGFTPKSVIKLGSLRLMIEYVRVNAGVTLIPEIDLKLVGSGIRHWVVPDMMLDSAVVRLAQNNASVVKAFVRMVCEVKERRLWYRPGCPEAESGRMLQD